MLQDNLTKPESLLGFYDILLSDYDSIEKYSEAICQAFINKLNFPFSSIYFNENGKFIENACYSTIKNDENIENIIKNEIGHLNVLQGDEYFTKSININHNEKITIIILPVKNLVFLLQIPGSTDKSLNNVLNKIYQHLQKAIKNFYVNSEKNELMYKLKEVELNNKTLTDILDHIPGKVFLKDPNGKMLLVNKRVADAHQCKKEDLLGKSDLDFFANDPKLAKQLWDEEQEIINSGNAKQFEQKEYVNNANYYLKTIKIPFNIHYLNKNGLLGIQFDISDVKKMQLEIVGRNKALEKSKNEIEFEKALLDNLLAYFPDLIYFKDKDSKFMRMSNSMVKHFKEANSVEDLIGKSDFDFHSKEGAQQRFDQEQKIIKTKKPLFDDVEHVIFENSGEVWLSTTKMPLLDKKGNAFGTFGISKDITEIKRLELELKEKNEELASHEEELRQNLEELYTTQEHLNQQLEENNKITKNLEFETALLDNLLKFFPDLIYFKDGQSRFIRMSKSMVKHFKGATSIDDLIGKSDFDFHTKEGAQQRFNQEQKIIKTKKPLLDDIEYAFIENTGEIWFSTTKMPLLDKKGKAIGTFGISKDITKIKKLEIELTEKNEELQAQEEELRQNLEELYTTQEHLSQQLEENKKVNEKLQEQSAELEENLEKLQILNEALDKEKQLTLSSIYYAQSIQKAMLPLKKNMDKFIESFILFKPRDIVSGDFYWFNPIFNETKCELNSIFLAVVDCTGHGVPGAFMSMLGNRLLNNIVTEKNIHTPSEILDKMDIELKKALKQDETENKDGMDVCLCKIEKINSEIKLTYCGAKRPLYIYFAERNKIQVIKGNRKSIGGYKKTSANIKFQDIEFNLSKGDLLYLTTDGLIDQNNNKRKRFGSVKFTQLLSGIAQKPLNNQLQEIENELASHQLSEKQRDDITIFGINPTF